jgi:hypothetical protein
MIAQHLIPLFDEHLIQQFPLLVNIECDLLFDDMLRDDLLVPATDFLTHAHFPEKLPLRHHVERF